jgi:hypothetical protein
MSEAEKATHNSVVMYSCVPLPTNAACRNKKMTTFYLTQPETPTTTVQTASATTGNTTDAPVAQAITIQDDGINTNPDLQEDNNENVNRKTAAPTRDQPQQQQQPRPPRRDVGWGQGLAAARARRQGNSTGQNNTASTPQ